jgi:hypothetical protein
MDSAFVNPVPMESRTEEGRFLLSCFWMDYAKRIVDFAIQHFHLSEEEAVILREKYLQADSYRIVLVD